ncbi:MULTISPECIES: hypothetical protein [Rhodanobacter]|uniref:hypothetical protein n=1 Tax=Rhodanobacter TaxID=75309 RepID=UPI000A56C713|nr:MULTISPECIES: hypothetical protein [Rhodanobacter]UJJ53267.1 hypothetical protein LRK53_09630 [Rhodanobacter thiooxydans]
MAHAEPRAMAGWQHNMASSPVAAIPAKAGVAALFACLLLTASTATPVHAATTASATPEIAALERAGCDAIAARVDALPGNTPVLLRSYDSERGQDAPALPPLHSAAFTYDNALAVIAMLACGRRPQAERIGEALRLAAMHDTRLRDAYRAGAVAGDKPLPNGWQDARRKQWVDAAHQYSGAYQDGSSCGNVAWTALALLALHDATGETRWRDAAVHLADWVVVHASGAHGAAGFHGGIESYLRVPRKASWKSTEHNIDLAAMFTWLARISAPGGDWNAQAKHARDFVALQWDAASGHFWTGTEGDGGTPLRSPSALDVQLWAQLLPDAPKAWQRALGWVERRHAVKGGYAFTDARDGMWTEGTAQAALAWRWVGDEARADTLFAAIAQQASPGGFLYATPEPRIVALYAWYYHRPCLAATAWAVIAASNRNPYLPSHAFATRHP